MNVSIEKINHLLRKYPSRCELSYLKDTDLSGLKFKSESDIKIEDVSLFIRAGFKEIDIVYTETLYDYLTIEFPREYRRPYSWMNFLEIDKHLENLDSLIVLSKRKRFIYVVGDVYGTDSKTAKRITILEHNEELDYEKWNSVKRYIDKEQKFFYRNSENGIILFVDLKDPTYGDYVERFKKNTDLITAMVSRREHVNVEIAPDFIETEDVISVTDPDNLLDEYVKNNIRLIIIGETLTEHYKKALREIRKYDKFARMIVVPSIDPRNIDHFLLQVKLVYNSDRWSD